MNQILLNYSNKSLKSSAWNRVNFASSDMAQTDLITTFNAAKTARPSVATFRLTRLMPSLRTQKISKISRTWSPSMPIRSLARPGPNELRALKKTPPQFALAQEEEIDKLMARFRENHPNGLKVQELETMLRSAISKPANAIVGFLLQEAADQADGTCQLKMGEEFKGRQT